jgi:hypothetical protein
MLEAAGDGRMLNGGCATVVFGVQRPLFVAADI